MPEGDTVFLAATRLRVALAGQTLARTEFRVPRFATANLAGRVVEDVESRGKHLLVRIGGGVTLHTHGKMEGSWHLYRPGERWRGPGWQVRVLLETVPWIAVGFRLAVAELIDTAREGEVLAHLGPDPLGRPGRTHWVYGRGGAPCLRCGTRIRVRASGDPERITYWCPRCQPPPSG